MTTRVLEQTSVRFARPMRALGVRVRLYPLWLVLPVAALASLIVSIVLMRQFAAMGIFYLDDTLFNSDPRSMLEVLSQGKRSISILYPELRNSIHPYLWFYFGPFIRVLAKIAAVTGISQGNEVQLRAVLGTFVIPLISTAQVVAFGLLLKAMGFCIRHIVLITALNIVAFSNLIFGAIPEHFAISNLALTLLILVAVLSLRARRMARPWVWISLGLFSAGVTITNAVAFGIVHLSTALQLRFDAAIRTVARSFTLALSIALFVLLSAYALGFAIDGPLEKGSVRDDFVPRYVRGDVMVWSAPLRALAALGNALAPDRSDIRTVAPIPVPSPYDPALAPPFHESPYPIYTLEPAPGEAPGIGLLGLIAVVGMALGAGAMVARGGLWRATAFVALGLIGYNMALHLVWGDEFFVYSQHWISPSLLLIAGLLAAAPRAVRPIVEGAFVLFLIALAWNNATVIAHVIASARAAAGLMS